MVAWGAGAAGPVLLGCRSGTPLGWRGGCLAQGLGRGAVRHYCRGGCSAPSVCARRSRPVQGVRAGTWCCVSLVSPYPPRVSRAACGRPSRPGVPYPRSLVRHSTRSVCSACSVRLPFWLSPRALYVCVRSHSRGVRSPPSWVVWRAHLARSRHWVLVGPFHVVCAPPCVLPRSLAPSGVLGGGPPNPGSPLFGLGLSGWREGVPRGGALHCSEGPLGSGAPPTPTARPLGGLLGSAIHVLWARACRCGGPSLSPWSARPVGAARRGAGPWRSCAGGRAGGGGGGGVRHALRLCSRGGGCRVGGRSASFRPSAFPEQATKRVSLASFCPRGGVAPHTTLVRARPPSLGAICAASWRVGAGSLVLRGSCGSRRLGRGGGSRSGSSLGRGRGDHPPCLGGWGTGHPRLASQVGGGGVAPRPPCSPSEWRPAVPHPACACGRGRGAVPGWGGMRGGPWTAPPGAPADLNPPSALCEWAVVMGGSCGARPPYCSGAQ